MYMIEKLNEAEHAMSVELRAQVPDTFKGKNSYNYIHSAQIFTL